MRANGAVRGPSKLTTPDLTPIEKTKTKHSTVGRMRGATPVEPARYNTSAGASAAGLPKLALRTDTANAVRQMLSALRGAWNGGSVSAVAKLYKNANTTSVVSDALALQGWSDISSYYRRQYPDPAQMGRLSFEQVRVQPLSSDVVVASGNFKREKEDEVNKGAFTLIWAREDGVWRITHHHTSSQ